MYFYGNYVYSNGPNWEDFNIISIFRVIFGQNLFFDPLGCPFIGFPQLLVCLARRHDASLTMEDLSAYTPSYKDVFHT